MNLANVLLATTYGLSEDRLFVSKPKCVVLGSSDVRQLFEKDSELRLRRQLCNSNLQLGARGVSASFNSGDGECIRL